VGARSRARVASDPPFCTPARRRRPRGRTTTRGSPRLPVSCGSSPSEQPRRPCRARRANPHDRPFVAGVAWARLPAGATSPARGVPLPAFGAPARRCRRSRTGSRRVPRRGRPPDACSRRYRFSPRERICRPRRGCRARPARRYELLVAVRVQRARAAPSSLSADRWIDDARLAARAPLPAPSCPSLPDSYRAALQSSLQRAARPQRKEVSHA